MSNKTKNVYVFGASRTDGDATMKNLLGGKGANLAEMCRLGIVVPPGLTISTEVCTVYTEQGQDAVAKLIEAEVRESVAFIEKEMGKKFGDSSDPLLLSVRSGSRASMPGMMDTILNLGLNDEAVAGLAIKANNERFAWDSYRRFIQMYGDVVMGLKPVSKEEHDPFEVVIDMLKEKKGVELDTDLTTDDLKELVQRFKGLIRARIGREFPTDPWEQLWGSVMAVFQSWNNDRAKVYRELNDIPDAWGTAVNVQAMVFGNLGDNSGTGVAFTRDAGTGEDLFNGEFLINAQGEDVVAGTRTPQQITLEGSQRWAQLAMVSEEDRRSRFPSLEELMPDIYRQLLEAETKLENHYKDMQDVEFTIQEGRLWMLQTRGGKRTGAAMVRIAMEMLRQGMIDEKEALRRVGPDRLNELLHPVFDPAAIKKARSIAHGLPASPGAATGQIVFFADEAEEWVRKGKAVILVRQETSPEDLRGMSVATGILTARGGMTSHAAVVARGMGKCCISGAGAVRVDYHARTMSVGGETYKEGDWISLDGSTGDVFEGQVPTKEAELTGDFGALMELTDKYKRLGIRANADTPDDAKVARTFGAKGIGLCRTEHMFFEGDRIKAVREMILSEDETGRRKALAKLLPMQRGDFEGLFREMSGLAVTIRLLDPPLHEFVPHDEANQKIMAHEMNVPLGVIKMRVDDLHEFNPMMGHRGCRLGITYPEITEMQTRAIIEAALNMKAKGVDVKAEIMVPLVGTVREFNAQAKVIRKTADAVFAERGEKIDYMVGTMIETPRAALIADSIGQQAEFFSFGTNDLTQMAMGFSRDDAGKFLPSYLKDGMYERDPFESIDQKGVGLLVQMAVEKGRAARPGIKLGVCGEHGGDPASIGFFHRTGLDYVSCSPFRVPIARLAAAQAALDAGS
ncbi:MAG: Pyruvate, phosphate dikinase [Candidatus Accumulibacter regalis]|jgi:pyruvate,orthophosphate dikinase|uniref:Pyruvate, phosphate dikinase n=1 Tax=Accumulibacter regalis TaxID=522306 RepID=A0A011QIZ6_ACCRE|nr:MULTISPECIES: pyruvate, phosphate dikinase [unclassified Candidatus Accumulibacter]EXI89332.1 MAG: Pyruvate, phosphate dikinase [Candidatus Accumulibacter regalis]MQM33139.1 pyruvate, phosphate dikinase [Candidatus Accumulibacter phosphatis]MBL8367671.1 pyruvate, phosphate dikinase [Accumulibacter sp.]MBN8513763.1 pyruvate, phosphate dikinase [Accumulibacter sp.]HRE69343.1 pyruvate, phosphate dikinase [Accumulibacter sp.]